jgi:hypothetical protein
MTKEQKEAIYQIGMLVMQAKMDGQQYVELSKLEEQFAKIASLV